MGNPDDITYRLDAGDLARFDLQASSWWAAGWSTRGEQLTYPGRHGNAAPAKPAVWDPQPLQLDMLLKKPTQVELQAVMTELTGLVAAGGVRTLSRVSAGEVTEQPCRVVSFQPGEFVVGRYAQVSVTVELMGPFWRAPSAVDRSLPAGTSTLPREGTAPVTDAVVRFAGPSSGSHTVTEGVWGTGITWTGSLVSGQHVFIDPRAMQAWQGASGDWGRPASSKDVSTGLSPATTGPLALHHKTGWGAGAVTATNESTDPRLQVPGDRGQSNSITEPAPGGGLIWSRAANATNANPWVNLGAHSAWSADFTNTTAVPLNIRTYVYRAGGYPNFTHRVLPGQTVRVGGWLPDGNTGAAALYLLGADTPGELPPPGSEIGRVDRLRSGPGAFTATGPAPYFDGDTPDTDTEVYEWTGKLGASASTVGPRVLTRSTPLTANRAATIRFKEAWL